MTKVLAMNIKGQLTYCSVPPELRGVGRCNHIAHQNEGESEEEFVERINHYGTSESILLSNKKNNENSKDSNSLREKTLEIKQYKMSDEEKANLPQILGKTGLQDETNEGGYIHLNEPLWNDMDKNCFSNISGNSVVNINKVIEGENHIITYLNKANPKAAKYQIGRIVTDKTKDVLKSRLGNDIEFDTGIEALNKAAKDGYDFEATTDVYVIPYFMRQDPPEGGTNIINTHYDYLIRNRNNPLQQQIAYERLLDNEHVKRFKQKKNGKMINQRLTSQDGYVVPSLSTMFKNKSGLIRGYLSGNTVPYTGRAVTTPDIDIEYGSMGVPPSILVDVFKPTIEDTLTQQGYSKDEIYRWRMKYKKRQTEVSKEDREELQGLLDYSGRRILGVRQPTLHESNLLCYKPVVSPDSTMHINPMNLAGMAGDHDGDTETIFGINDVGISRLAEKEMGAKTISGTRWSKNQSQSINEPAKESLFGLLQILGERDATERK